MDTNDSKKSVDDYECINKPVMLLTITKRYKTKQSMIFNFLTVQSRAINNDNEEKNTINENKDIQYW